MRKLTYKEINRLLWLVRREIEYDECERKHGIAKYYEKDIRVLKIIIRKLEAIKGD